MVIDVNGQILNKLSSHLVTLIIGMYKDAMQDHSQCNQKKIAKCPLKLPKNDFTKKS